MLVLQSVEKRRPQSAEELAGVLEGVRAFQAMVQAAEQSQRKSTRKTNSVWRICNMLKIQSMQLLRLYLRKKKLKAPSCPVKCKLLLCVASLFPVTRSGFFETVFPMRTVASSRVFEFIVKRDVITAGSDGWMGLQLKGIFYYYHHHYYNNVVVVVVHSL